MKVYVSIVLLLLFVPVFGQQPSGREVTVEASEKSFTLGEPFLLSIVVKNSARRPSVQFPDLAGLEKRSASATTTTSSIAGKPVLIQTISQSYYALREGELKIKPSIVTVDEFRIRLDAITFSIKKNEQPSVSTDSEIENLEIVSDETELAAGDIFLSLKVSKPTVYVREGFSVRLALYVAKSAPIEMEFYKLDVQLSAILRKLRPATCWEENVGIEEIIQREVQVGGRSYTEYQMYQAMFFPITLQTVSFPAVGLDMLLMTPNPEGQKKQKKVTRFYSSPTRVLVRPLPPHPHRDQIAVGQYRLREKLTRRALPSGESLRYLFTIEGEGNLATIAAPDVPENPAFDFYPPELSQTVQRSYDKVSGRKTFDYFIVAKQNGTYPLGRFFQWVYFDPAKGRYDTLRSEATIKVAGRNMPTVQIAGEGANAIYDNIEDLDTNDQYIDYQRIIQNLTNLVIAVLLGLMVWIFRK